MMVTVAFRSAWRPNCLVNSRSALASAVSRQEAESSTHLMSVSMNEVIRTTQGIATPLKRQGVLLFLGGRDKVFEIPTAVWCG